MTKRQETERTMQTKIDQLQGEMDRMRYAPALITTTQTVRPPPTPAEKYVQPRSRVNHIQNNHFILQSFILANYSIKRITKASTRQ